MTDPHDPGVDWSALVMAVLVCVFVLALGAAVWLTVRVGL